MASFYEEGSWHSPALGLSYDANPVDRPSRRSVSDSDDGSSSDGQSPRTPSSASLGHAPLILQMPEEGLFRRDPTLFSPTTPNVFLSPTSEKHGPFSSPGVATWIPGLVAEKPVVAKASVDERSRPSVTVVPAGPRPKSDSPIWDSPAAWLIYYFSFNLGLTLFNKIVLQGFPFAWTLTAVHSGCGIIGSSLAQRQGYFKSPKLTRRELVTLAAFSVLYTVNIAVSNVSLNMVTIPFHQVVRGMTPLFIVFLYTGLYKRTYSLRTYLALAIVVFGVGLSTYGDYGWTTWGLFLTFLGTLLAAAKGVATNAILVGRLKLHPLDLLLRMSYLACAQCIVYAYLTGETGRIADYAAKGGLGWQKVVALAVNGALAFGLNVVSFTGNKRLGPLTMTVAANVKQVLTIALSVFVFNLTITPSNGLGILVTIAGGVAYSKVELDAKRNAKPAPAVAEEQIVRLGPSAV